MRWKWEYDQNYIKIWEWKRNENTESNEMKLVNKNKMRVMRIKNEGNVIIMGNKNKEWK